MQKKRADIDEINRREFCNVTATEQGTVGLNIEPAWSDLSICKELASNLQKVIDSTLQGLGQNQELSTPSSWQNWLVFMTANINSNINLTVYLFIHQMATAVPGLMQFSYLSLVDAVALKVRVYMYQHDMLLQEEIRVCNVYCDISQQPAQKNSC